jgi:hypothetical protein
VALNLEGKSKPKPQRARKSERPHSRQKRT